MGEQSQKEGKAAKKFEVGTLVFPSNLRKESDDGGPWMRFEIKERVLSGEDVSAGEICLYMPNNISTGDGMVYGSFNKGITGQGMNLLKNFLGFEGGKGEITAADATAAQELVAGQIPVLGTPLQIEAIERGISQNPNAVTTFDGINLRSFTYNFKLMAQTEAESETIKKICNAFRFFMYPEKLGAVAMQFPASFLISYHMGDDVNPYIPGPHRGCYLESMSENTNASGNSVHRKGQPVEIDLSLTFKEAQPYTRNELFDEYTDWVGKDNIEPFVTTDETGG